MSVRHLIAHRTRAAHERLHIHPLIGRLVDPAITRHEYMRALRAFQDVYTLAENRRASLAVWGPLSLAEDCADLQADTGEEVADRPYFSDISTAPAMLGVLYALHGAKFGAAVINRNLARSLPEAPRTYFSKRGNSGLWRALTSAMERYGEGTSQQHHLVQGALKAFAVIEQRAS